MTPSQLKELERTFLNEPTRFNEALASLCDLAHTDEGARSMLHRGVVYLPSQAWKNVSDAAKEPNAPEPVVLLARVAVLAGCDPHVRRLAHENRLSALEPQGPAGPRDPGLNVPMDVWERACRSKPRACVVQQTLACLYLLRRFSDLRVARVAQAQTWIIRAATDRLHELMLEHPILAHPGFLYPYGEADAAIRPSLPLLNAILDSHGTFPCSARIAGERQQRAWATHRVTTVALLTPAPSTDTGPVHAFLSQGSSEGKTFTQAFSDKSSVEAATFASMLRLDRMRFEHGAANPQGRLPQEILAQALSGIAGHLTNPARDRARLKALDIINSKFMTSVLDEADRVALSMLPEGGGAPAKPSQRQAALLDELRQSPTLVPRTFPMQFITAVDALVEQVWHGELQAASPGEPARHLLDVRLDELLTQMVEVRAFESKPEAAQACAAHLFTSYDDHQFMLQEADRTLPEHALATLIHAFERYGVTREETLSRLEARSVAAPRLTAAARSLVTERSMSAILAGVSPSASNAAAPRARRNAL